MLGLSGWGVLVVAAGLIGLITGFMLGDALTDLAHLPYGPAYALGMIAGGLTAAAGLSLFVEWYEKPDEEVYFHPDTRQPMRDFKHAGTLLFIPTRYWSWILLALSVLFAVSLYNEPSSGVLRP